jgi:hypothetical protein
MQEATDAAVKGDFKVELGHCSFSAKCLPSAVFLETLFAFHVTE